MGSTLNNVISYTKCSFPISVTGLVGMSRNVAMGEGSYFIEGLNGWDGTGFWVAAKDLQGRTISPLAYVIWIAVGYI